MLGLNIQFNAGKGLVWSINKSRKIRKKWNIRISAYSNNMRCFSKQMFGLCAYEQLYLQSKGSNILTTKKGGRNCATHSKFAYEAVSDQGLV